MKVAICLYGQPRKYKQVLGQWQKIISSLDADVFIHTWNGQDRGRVNIDVNELLEDFSPKELQVSNPHRFVDLIPKDAAYENQSYHGMNQAYTINKCFQLVTSYSQTMNKEYDIIIRSRFDLTFHDVEKFIQFIQNEIDANKLYVAANHWQGSPQFDDNLMVARGELLMYMSLHYFNFTIKFINDTKIIPGGEHNIFRYVNSLGLGNRIMRADSLNFELIRLPFNEIILNQNEE